MQCQPDKRISDPQASPTRCRINNVTAVLQKLSVNILGDRSPGL